MAQFKKLKYGDTRSLTRHTGKGAREQVLPHRDALNTLTGPFSGRTLNDYSKVTPSPSDAAPSILDYANQSDT
jgi:hypothetical protein